MQRSNAELSPVKIFPFSSQKILRSPSPSKAIPRLEFVLITRLDNLSKFWGVGSEPRPGKSPSISSLIVKTSQSNFWHNFFAVTDYAPFPRSRQTLNFLFFILFVSTREIIPSIYVEITFVSSSVFPNESLFIQFFSS